MAHARSARLRTRRSSIRTASVLAGAAVTATLVGTGTAASAAVISAADVAFLPTGAIQNPFKDVPVVGQIVGVASPNVVTPGDTFSLALTGFNNSTNSGIFLSATVSPTFGTTTAYTGAALGGQTLTVASTETIGATVTTDTVVVSVPTNFIPTGTTFNTSAVNNQTVNFIELDLGLGNGGTNPINFLLPIDPTTNTSSGSLLFNGTSTLALRPGLTFGTGGTSVSAFEAVSNGTGDLAPLALRQFTLTVNYATTPVPEPATAGLAATAAAALLAGRRRRHSVGGPTD